MNLTLLKKGSEPNQLLVVRINEVEGEGYAEFSETDSAVMVSTKLRELADSIDEAVKESVKESVNG